VAWRDTEDRSAAGGGHSKWPRRSVGWSVS